MIYSQAGCGVLPSTKTAKDKSLNPYLGSACEFSVESQDSPVLFILNGFFEVKSNPDNHFCILPSQWTTDYRFPRPDYRPFYFHLYRSAWKSCKCHSVFSYLLTWASIVIIKEQPVTNLENSIIQKWLRKFEKKSTKVLISQFSFYFFCVEVTLQSANRVRVQMSRKCGVGWGLH